LIDGRTVSAVAMTYLTRHQRNPVRSGSRVGLRADGGLGAGVNPMIYCFPRNSRDKGAVIAAYRFYFEHPQWILERT
jgi:hypothetical protein